MSLLRSYGIERNQDIAKVGSVLLSAESAAKKATESPPEFSPWPCYSEEEAMAVKNLLLSNKVNYWTGSEIKTFEREYAKYIGSTHAIGVTNGTLALDLILNNLPEDNRKEIIVTPRTYIASASSIAMAGYKPVFVDVDRDSQNLCIEAVSRAIGPNTIGIMAVHLAGWPCDMASLQTLCRDNSLYLIEDCAQAHGAMFDDKAVGSIGDAAAWSFCQEKIMTTGGEGGMVTTNNNTLFEKMWSYKEHGKCRRSMLESGHPPGFRWLHESFGSNFRMLEFQAAIGRIQLRKLPKWVQTRRQNADTIWRAARNIPGIRVPEIPFNIQHACYKCYVFVEPDQLKAGWNRDRVLAEIAARGVPVYSGACPEVYREQAFTNTSSALSERLPVARELGETSLMFVVHPTLTEDELSLTCNVLSDVMALAVA